MSLGVFRLASLRGDGWADETGVELGTDSSLVDRFGRAAFEFVFDVEESLACGASFLFLRGSFFFSFAGSSQFETS
jgi:hypothetical protein